jgi:site-specific recombinase XerD
MKLKEILSFCIKYLQYEKNLSPNTIESYSKDISQFLKFLENKEIDKPDEINLDIFRQYLKYLDDFKYSNRTLIRKYSSYINFLNFMEDNEYIDKQISQLIIPPKKHHKLYTFLSQTEIRELMDNIDVSSDLGKRNKALIEFIYSTGTRVSEAGNIQLKDLDLEECEVRVLGKGRKIRTVYLNKHAKTWLQKYLDIRQKLLFKRKKDSYEDSGYVFLNRFGNRLTARSIRNILGNCLKEASIGKKVSPHGIRHSFATHLVQEGAGIREIQELLGHENISTTQIYTHLNIRKIKNDYKKYHPRAK